MSNSEGVAVGCLIFIGLVPLALSVVFTNVYAQKYEPEGTNLAEASGEWLLGVIIFGLFIVCGSGAGSAEILFALAICLGVCINIVSIIAGILICVSTSKSDSGAGKAIGALAAVFTFFVVCTPWCILASCSVQSGSRRSGSGRYIHSRSPPTRHEESTGSTVLDKMSDEDKAKVLQMATRCNDNAITGEDIKTLMEMQQKYA